LLNIKFIKLDILGLWRNHRERRITLSWSTGKQIQACLKGMWLRF